jgi:hypothetical protein
MKTTRVCVFYLLRCVIVAFSFAFPHNHIVVIHVIHSQSTVHTNKSRVNQPIHKIKRNYFRTCTKVQRMWYFQFSIIFCRDLYSLDSR